MKKLLYILFVFVLFVLFVLSFLKYKTPVTHRFETIQDTIIPQPTEILKSGLPNKHLIQTAFIPQAPEKNWDQPWQDACEEASLLTVHYYYLQKTPNVTDLLNEYRHLFDAETQLGYSHDVNLSQMADISKSYLMLSPKIIDNPQIEDIKKFIAQDVPVIVPANGKTLFQENKRFKNGGPWYHNLVILGYDDNRSQFIVHDVGTQFGAYHKYSYSLLMSAIHDFPLSGKKEEIESGDKKILVLLK